MRVSWNTLDPNQLLCALPVLAIGLCLLSTPFYYSPMVQPLAVQRVPRKIMPACLRSAMLWCALEWQCTYAVATGSPASHILVSYLARKDINPYRRRVAMQLVTHASLRV